MGLLDRSRKIVQAPRPTTLQLARPFPARIEQHFLATDIVAPAGYLEFTSAAHRVVEKAFGAFDLAAYDSLTKEVEIAAARIDELSPAPFGGLSRLGLFGPGPDKLTERFSQLTVDETDAEIVILRAAIQTARDKQDELLRTEVERIGLARMFLRQLGAGGFLPGAKTVDKSGKHRTIQAEAWSSELNWQQLITDRVFNSGERGTLILPGRVFVPSHQLDEIVKDMAGRGVDDFRLHLSACRAVTTSSTRASGELIVEAANAVFRPGMRATERNQAIRDFMHERRWSPSPTSPCDSAIRKALHGTEHVRSRRKTDGH